MRKEHTEGKRTCKTRSHKVGVQAGTNHDSSPPFGTDQTASCLREASSGVSEMITAMMGM